MNSVKSIIESLLFVSKDPISADRIKTVLDHIEIADIRKALDELIADYAAREGGFYIRHVAGGYQFCSSPEHKQWIKRLYQTSPPRLSKAAMESLAIIAWKQPIIRSDIELIRGVDCGGVLRILMERKLIRVIGRKEIPGRPLIYATTKHFLEVFDLKDIKDLPTPREIEGFGNVVRDDPDSAAINDQTPDVPIDHNLEIGSDEASGLSSDENPIIAGDEKPETGSEVETPFENKSEDISSDGESGIGNDFQED